MTNELKKSLSIYKNIKYINITQETINDTVLSKMINMFNRYEIHMNIKSTKITISKDKNSIILKGNYPAFCVCKLIDCIIGLIEPGDNIWKTEKIKFPFILYIPTTTYTEKLNIKILTTMINLIVEHKRDIFVNETFLILSITDNFNGLFISDTNGVIISKYMKELNEIAVYENGIHNGNKRLMTKHLK